MKTHLWVFTMLLISAGCATGQEMPLQALEKDIALLQKQQEGVQADFDRRMSSMEMSLLRQEKFLAEAQDYFNVSGTASNAFRDPEPAKVNPMSLRPAEGLVPASQNKRSLVQSEKTSPAGLKAKPKIKADADPGRAFYAQALKKYFSGDYDQAREDFLIFASRYPDHPLQPNALYWLAETHYAQKQYAQSILIFKELTRRFPQSHKVPDALLKAGYAYERLGDIPNAKFHLQIVLDDYPSTPAARLARERMATLAGS